MFYLDHLLPVNLVLRCLISSALTPLLSPPTAKISLYENIQVPDAELAEQELYDSALAHIWEGYTQRWPHRKSPAPESPGHLTSVCCFIPLAVPPSVIRLLTRLSFPRIEDIFRAYMLLGMISERPNLGLDVRLERNVCALLLGKEQDEGLGKRMTYGAEEPAKMDNPQIHDSSLGESTEALGNESAIEVMVGVILSSFHQWASTLSSSHLVPNCDGMVCFRIAQGRGLLCLAHAAYC